MTKNSPDGVFYPEVLFSLYNTSRESKVYKTFFDPSLSIARILTMAGNLSTGRVNGTYEIRMIIVIECGLPQYPIVRR